MLTLPGVVRHVYAKHLPLEDLKQLASLLVFLDPRTAFALDDDPKVGDELDKAKEKVKAVADAIEKLCATQLELQPKLSEFDVPEEEMEEIAKAAVERCGERFEGAVEDVVEVLKSVF